MNTIDHIINTYKPQDTIIPIVYDHIQLLNENKFLKTELLKHKQYIMDGMMGLTFLFYGVVFVYFL